MYLVSTRTVKLDTKSRVSFYLSDGSVLPNVATVQQQSSTPNSSHREQLREPFPIHKLASPATPSIFHQTTRQPPTPPLDDDYDDPDAMAWSPAVKRSSNSFNPPPRSTTTQIASNFSGPSPFHGTLPPAPMAPAHRLRKPASALPGAFRKASDTQKDIFSASMSTAADMPRRPFYGLQELTYANGYESDTTAGETDYELGHSNLIGRRRTDIQMAAPKFWAATDVERKTGLEDIFEESFSIQDTPNGISNFAETPNPFAGRRHRVGGGSASTERKGERWGGFGERMGVRSVADGRDNAEEINDVVGGGFGGGVLVAMIPVIILGISVAVVKGGWI